LNRLDDLLAKTRQRDSIHEITTELIAGLPPSGAPLIELGEFDSPEDFVQRGGGLCSILSGVVVGAAYASLVCSKGIEVSIVVLPEFRRRGIATALACCLLKQCIGRSVTPHWDAANHESCRLAEKLGYVRTGSYDSLYLQSWDSPRQT
jgi:GNAT superfamily N-acetyltransferase